MDPENLVFSNKEHQKVELVAQQLFKAMNQQSHNESNITIFLSKLYKNNFSLKNKKMKSIRLNRFISLLEYIVGNFPSQKEDIDILSHSILSTLINDKNFNDQEDEELVETMGIEFARIIEKLSEGQFGGWAVRLLSYLIKGEKIALMDMIEFEQTIKTSAYYQSINIQNEFRSQSFSEQQYDGSFLDTVDIKSLILKKINISNVYSKLFKTSENKFVIVELFYDHMRKLNKFSKSRKQLFVQSFLQSDKLTVSEAQAILKILQKQLFDRESINQIISSIVQSKMTFDQLILIDFRNMKGIQEVFIQSLLQQSSKKQIQQLIELFLNLKDSHNYFPLYMILKMNKKIPLQYTNLLFENQTFTVRRSIIFVLAIIQNQLSSFDTLLKGFYDWSRIQKVRTKKMYQCALKAVHFSLQNISKANLISTILKYINKRDLNGQSHLEYLSYNSLRVSTNEQLKHFITQNNRQILLKLFQTLSEFDKMVTNKNIPDLNIEELKQLELQHKFRLDLQFVVNNNPFVEQQILLNIKQLNKHLEDQSSIEELVKKLPTIKENLLQVILMWINNKYDTFYTQDVNNNTIEWTLKAYKKYTSELHSQLKTVLQKQKLQKYFKLVKTLIQYGMQKQILINIEVDNPKIFTSNIKQIINLSNLKTQRMSNNNFNDYFLTQSKWKTYISCPQSPKNFEKTYKKIIWIKMIMLELKQLIKNMVKAQKAGNRKQIKNIIAQKVEDVLALRGIHEYFQSQIDEGKQVLIQVFRNVQPQFQFFQRTQKLASSLNIEYFSIYEELPNLLENFNSDTLKFLQKLLSSSKITTTEKSKKNKKKSDKDNIPEDFSQCLDIIVKNLSLLFGDPNGYESYKSLFIILRKLIDTQKIKKQDIAANLNTWLMEINFIPCIDFQNWKNRVHSLSKMWKNATDLLIQNKIQLKVLQKHFNLFTDLLNKLYQNFREQSEFIQIQQRLLLSLCLIYKQLNFSDAIQVEHDMVAYIVKKFQEKNISRIVLENKFYQCYECKKKACYACSSFLHRNHDKIYLGKTGNCEHQNPKVKKEIVIKSQNGSLFGGVAAYLKKNQDLPQEFLQRIKQKLMLQQQFKSAEQADFFFRVREQQHLRQALQGKGGKSRLERGEQLKKKIRQKQAALLRQELMRGEQEKQPQQNQKTMTLEAEDCFQYKEGYCKQFKKIHAEFDPVLPHISIPNPKINVSPLAKVFLRELTNQTFARDQNQKIPSLKDKEQGCQLIQIKQKYVFFRNNNLKADNRDYPYGRGRGGYGGTHSYGQNPQNPQILRRNFLSCNKKCLFIPSSLSLMSLAMTNIKAALQKKIQNKQYSKLEQQKTYISTNPVNLPFDALQTSLSRSASHPILATVGYNQICFYPITPDGKYARQLNTQFHRSDNIVKFCWINENKNLFAIGYTNYIRIGGISPSSNIKTFAKAQIGKTIRDFDGQMNSKMYFLYIIDSDGKLYFIEVEFKDIKGTSFSAADRLINLVDQNGQKIVDQIYSVKNIDGNKILVSCASGNIRIAEVSRDSNTWNTKSFDLKKNIKAQNSIILDSIKLIKHDDDSILISAIARKINTFESLKQRKQIGSLVLIKISQNSSTSQILFTKEQNIQSYDYTFVSPNSLMFVYSNQEGLIYLFKHIITLESQQITQKITLNLSNHQVREYNKKFLASNIFQKIEEGGMLKNLQFKDNKVITAAFTMNAKQKKQLSLKQNQACTNFVTGIGFQVQLPSTVTEYMDQNNKRHVSLVKIQLNVMNCNYTFDCSTKLREIQLPFNLKQTLQLFAHQNDIKITYSYDINSDILQKQKYSQKQLQQFVRIKKVHIYGYQTKDFSSSQQPSIYHTAYRQLVYDWVTYQQYNKEGLQEYCLNSFRLDFQNIQMKKLYKLKYDNANHGFGFKPAEINLFLKLQLFAQTVSQSLSNNKQNSVQDIEEYINCIRKSLLSKDYRRKSLENSVVRLSQVMSKIYEEKSQISVGHPYHQTSLLNFHNFSVLYQKWHQKRNFLAFQKLCNQLSNLVFNQAIDLYLILQIYPDLIIQISTYFNSLLSEKRNKNIQDGQTDMSITKICSKYISIVCEYYQVLKNKKVQNVEQKMLHLLEQVFGKNKSQMSKQMIMNPFIYLQSLFRLQNSTQIKTSIDIFNVGLSNQMMESFFDLQKGDRSNKKPKKQSDVKQQEQKILTENNDWQAIEQEKQMDEQQKQMYMEIEEQFDEQEDLMIEQVQILEVQSKKQKSSLKDPNLSSIQLHQQSNIHKNPDQNITKTLLQKVLNPCQTALIKHYDFPIELAIALFRKPNYLTSSNVYFYLGLFYNLLKIIEDNLKLKQDKNKIFELLEVIDQKIQNPQYSSLFIIVNFFVSPLYTKNNQQITLNKPHSRLAQYFIEFYKQKLPRFIHLLTEYNPIKVSTGAKFSQIMRFQPFQLQNELYNLKVILNLYLCFRLYGQSFNQHQLSTRIKEQLLFKVVKYKVSVAKNIMIFQNWVQQLDRVKILVSFQILNKESNKEQKIQEGVNLLHQCAKQTPDKYIEQLLNDQSKVNFLQEFSLQPAQTINQNIQKKVFELLEIYYNS